MSIANPLRRRIVRYRHQGFSLLELVVVIVIISVLLVIAISRLLALRVDAERVAMETVVGALNSALGIKLAEHIIRNDIRGLGALEATNPMERLSQIPANYIGELSNPDLTTVDSGNWYFDTRSRVLVYLVRNKSFFEGGLSDPPRARFAIRVVYTDHNQNGRYDQTADAVEGIGLAVLETYRWKK